MQESINGFVVLGWDFAQKKGNNYFFNPISRKRSSK